MTTEGVNVVTSQSQIEDFWNDLGRPVDEPLDLSLEEDNGVHYMFGRDIAGDSEG